MARRNVAIYARVSTEHEAQLSALENQIQYYDEILARHSEWVLYDRYIDEGITGTSIHKRENFMRMLSDAEEGRFDLIITREVSRFARNTVDTLQETRKLKKLGVEVWFTEDNIWTLNDEDGELRLTIMATLAQNESKKISQRVKAGQKVSFQNAVIYGNGNMLGYERDKITKEFRVCPEQAETVKQIYRMYLEGHSLNDIKDELERQGKKTAMGRSTWYIENISKVLSNPFYCGTIIYRKEYVPDYLEQKKIKNDGSIEKIVVEGKRDELVLVSKEDFEKVQEIKRSRTIVRNDKKMGILAPESVWKKKLECACGHKFLRSKWGKDKNGKIKYGYRCDFAIRHGTVATRKKKGLPLEEYCDSPMFAEWKLKLMAGMIFREIWGDRKRILDIANKLLKNNISDTKPTVDRTSEIKACENGLKQVERKLNNLLEMRLGGEIEPEAYKKKRSELERQREDYERRIANLGAIVANTQKEDKGMRIESIKQALEQKIYFDTYDIPDAIIDAFVDKVIVYKDKFEWYLNLFDKDNTSVIYSKTEIKPTSCILGEDSISHQAVSSTGSYR